MHLPSLSAEQGVWRIKVVVEARPDALARAILLLETQEVVPLRLVARRAAVRGGTTSVLQIEIEFAGPDFAPGALGRFVAILAELPTVLSVVVADPYTRGIETPGAVGLVTGDLP